MRSWTRGTILIITGWLALIVALQTAVSFHGRAEAAPVRRAPAPQARVTTIAMRAAPVTERAPAGFDVPAVRAHVTGIARLVGKPAHALVDRLGRAAVVGDGMIEWNLGDVGVAAGGTYGYATIVRGRITGILFRGRTEADTLRHLRLPHALQLTEAGGERPSFSIVVGE